MTTPGKAKKATSPTPTAPDLRSRAEERLREHPPASPRRGSDLKRLVHELQVHQVELEMQNDELLMAREERELALHKYADLYDFAPIGYVTLAPDGTVREANLAAARLLNLDRSQLVRRRLSLRVAATQWADFTAFLKRVFDGKGTETYEVTLWREGGSTTEVRVEAAPSEDGRECRAVFYDITGHKQAESDRATISKLESTRILAEGLSHDFNNLLTVIVLNLDLAQTADPTDGQQADLLAAAKRCAVVASSLVHQLMTFAQGDAPVRRMTSLNAVLRKSVQDERGGSGRYDFNLADDLWQTEVDVPQITEVIHNLVANAWEAMSAVGVVSIQSENVTHNTCAGPPLPFGKYVLVSIADQGGGIAPSARSRIFDPYYSTKTRGNQKGMGLGLAICLAIIRSHGGTIVLDPASGPGALFHIYLPAAPTLAVVSAMS